MDIDQIISQEIKDFQRALVAKDEARSKALDAYVRPRIVVRESILPMGSLPIPTKREDKKVDATPIPTWCGGNCLLTATLVVSGISITGGADDPNGTFSVPYLSRNNGGASVGGGELCLWQLVTSEFTYNIAFNNLGTGGYTVQITTNVNGNPWDGQEAFSMSAEVATGVAGTNVHTAPPVGFFGGGTSTVTF